MKTQYGKLANFGNDNGTFKLEFDSWGIWPAARGYYMKYELDMHQGKAYFLFRAGQRWVVVPQMEATCDEYKQLDHLFGRVISYFADYGKG